MSTHLKRKAISLFPKTSYNDLEGVKYLRRAWLNSVLLLGDKWVISKKIERID